MIEHALRVILNLRSNNPNKFYIFMAVVTRYSFTIQVQHRLQDHGFPKMPPDQLASLNDSSALETQKTRNKLNQRAFRQRRQQRVQELEDKLRQYEAAQLNATQQMQQAARVVAAENEMLRDVLKQRLGIGEREIEDLRREWIRGNGTIFWESRAFNSRGENADRIQTAQDDGRRIESVRLPASGQSDTCGELPHVRCCDRTSDATNQKLISNQPAESSVFMSCEKAAEILSSIRTQDEYYDVRARLGCTTPNTCMIENTTVMDVMNESI